MEKISFIDEEKVKKIEGQLFLNHKEEEKNFKIKENFLLNQEKKQKAEERQKKPIEKMLFKKKKQASNV